MTHEEIRHKHSLFVGIGLAYKERKRMMSVLIKQYLSDKETITRQFFEEFEQYIRETFKCYTFEDFLISLREAEIYENCVEVKLPRTLVYSITKSPENLLPLIYDKNLDNVDIFELLGMDDNIDRYMIFKWIFWNCLVKYIEDDWDDDYYIVSSQYLDKAKKYVPEFLERLMSENKELFEKYETEREKEFAINRKYDTILYKKHTLEERKKVLGIWYGTENRRLIKIID